MKVRLALTASVVALLAAQVSLADIYATRADGEDHSRPGTQSPNPGNASDGSSDPTGDAGPEVDLSSAEDDQAAGEADKEAKNASFTNQTVNRQNALRKSGEALVAQFLERVLNLLVPSADAGPAPSLLPQPLLAAPPSTRTEIGDPSSNQWPEVLSQTKVDDCQPIAAPLPTQWTNILSCGALRYEILSGRRSAIDPNCADEEFRIRLRIEGSTTPVMGTWFDIKATSTTGESFGIHDGARVFGQQERGPYQPFVASIPIRHIKQVQLTEVSFVDEREAYQKWLAKVANRECDPLTHPATAASCYFGAGEFRERCHDSVSFTVH